MTERRLDYRPSMPPEAEVLAAFEALFTTLTEQRDADAGTRLFTDDEDIVMWGSDEAEQAVGPDEVAALHRAIVASPTRIAFSWQRRQVRVEGDVAWVNAAGEVRVERTAHEPQTVSYRVTAVLVRRAGTWLWHTFSGSEPNPS